MKAVTGGDRRSVLPCQFDHRLIRARPADQALARGFAEGEPELDAGHRTDQSLVDVFDGLDEMGLPEDEVDLLGLLDPHRDELHDAFLDLMGRNCRSGSMIMKNAGLRQSAGKPRRSL